MRYLCCALPAVILALFINFFLAMFLSRTRKVSQQAFLSGAYTNMNVTNTSVNFIRQSRTYSPKSSGSGSHSHGGHPHSFHLHSGGGGGHRI